MLDQLKGELAETPSVKVTGPLNMTSLLVLPPGLRQLLTWVMRQKVVQVNTVAQFLEQEECAVQSLIDSLVKKGLLEEERTENGAIYQVPIHSSRNYRVPDKVWKAIDE